ncbi:MAG TPA: hypothetical protein ENN67_00200 [Firmicutes bacterium]|nr:hypothetical protein [Bacillota bacterium]
MTEFHTARVLSNEPIAEAQAFITLEVPREIISAHREPGQWVDIVSGEMNPWHGTIANRPGRDRLDFLVKAVGERSGIISKLKPGDEIKISAPKGPGFPLNANRRCNVIMACCGVAVCAMRSLIEEILIARHDWRTVSLFYGERTADRFAFMEEMENWKENGIDIFLSASRPAEGTYWRGHVGYVQENLMEIKPDINGTIAFLAGKDAMIDEVSSILSVMGMPPNRIFLNT